MANRNIRTTKSSERVNPDVTTASRVSKAADYLALRQQTHATALRRIADNPKTLEVIRTTDMAARGRAYLLHLVTGEPLSGLPIPAEVREHIRTIYNEVRQELNYPGPRAQTRRRKKKRR